VKLEYTTEEIEKWRERVHRHAVRTKLQVLAFVQRTGFCFALNPDQSELPSLWHVASRGRASGQLKHARGDACLSFVRQVKDTLASEGKIFHGKVLRKRPTLISLEYFPYFYVLAGRNGSRDEYMTEFFRGGLSSLARDIMDALTDSFPQSTAGLRGTTGFLAKGESGSFDRAMSELQEKMFITKIGEHGNSHPSAWLPVSACFSSPIRKSRRISPEEARRKVLEKYFQNQLIASVPAIERLFGWTRRSIYQTMGDLVQRGVITSDVKVDGKVGRAYCLVR
jgi:hypothetical protein